MKVRVAAVVSLPAAEGYDMPSKDTKMGLTNHDVESMKPDMSKTPQQENA